MKAFGRGLSTCCQIKLKTFTHDVLLLAKLRDTFLEVIFTNKTPVITGNKCLCFIQFWGEKCNAMLCGLVLQFKKSLKKTTKKNKNTLWNFPLMKCWCEFIIDIHCMLFSFKGLVVDLEDGNLVKLAEDGTVLRYVQTHFWFPTSK